jgi:hypothetical protein
MTWQYVRYLISISTTKTNLYSSLSLIFIFHIKYTRARIKYIIFIKWLHVCIDYSVLQLLILKCMDYTAFIYRIRINMLRWIGHVNRMNIKRMVYKVFANQPRGSRLRGRPNPRWWDCVYGDITKCKIRNWEQRWKNREDWMRSIKEAKTHIQ